MLYEQMEPFGDGLIDRHLAQLAYLIAEPNRDRKRRPQPFTPQDFSLAYREREPVSAASALRKLAVSLGAKVVRREHDR